MVQVNGNYLKLKAGYLFPEIGRRVKAFSSANPEAALIRLGIGDVTEPLPLACREAMKTAIDAMGTAEGFHGYGPEQGYGWLREAIAKNDFQARGCDISAEEIFVPTAPSATAATSSTSSARATRWPSRTPSIRCTWTGKRDGWPHRGSRRESAATRD